MTDHAETVRGALMRFPGGPLPGSLDALTALEWELKGLRNLRALVDRDTREKDALRSENARLREALEDLLDYPNSLIFRGKARALLTPDQECICSPEGIDPACPRAHRIDLKR
jgi:hypothetical protein